MKTYLPRREEDINPENPEHCAALVRHLLDNRHPGILCTVDECEFPRVRWMATVAFDHYTTLYTLTAPGSRKLEQIRRHPTVEWMFSDFSTGVVANLIGRAEIFLEDEAAMKKVWDSIADKSRAYFLRNGNGSWAVIKTTIEMIELTLAKRGITIPIEPASLKVIENLGEQKPSRLKSHRVESTFTHVL